MAILDFTLPTCVNIRKCKQFIREGRLFNGKPMVEKDGAFWVWQKAFRLTNSGWRKAYKWDALICSQSEYLKKGYIRNYTIENWLFQRHSVSKNAKNGSLYVQFKGKKTENLDFSVVIVEAKKRGFNVEADFLKKQVEIIQAGYKQLRYLPDCSGCVFSPIYCNGIIFEFSAIKEDVPEYIV